MSGCKYYLPVLLLLVLMISRPASSQQSETDVSFDPVASANAFVDGLARKDFSVAETRFDETMHTALPAAKLEETWNGLIQQAGTLKEQLGSRTEERGGYTIVIVNCQFQKAAVDIRVVFDQAHKIAGLFFAPSQPVVEYTPPAYVKPTSFQEKEVTVGTGEWALPGTLTLPAGKGKYPAVVLVHGSGPNDRDETIGPNKPFRDLAWGLASHGIAVLRYEKRTRQYRDKLRTDSGQLTVKEETLDDAVAAVDLLRKTDGVDHSRIFVLGHSLGGMLVPRIGLMDPKISGFIVLAGAARPLEDAILEQTTYIFSLDGTISKEEQTQLDEIKKNIERIRNLKPEDTRSSQFLFSAPPSYWLDLRGYDPPATAAKLKQPMLILQGERDYQVTMAEFLKWKTVLSARKNVSLKSYPKLNHLFMEGSGKSQPAEYDSAGHVSGDVIDDIAGWILIEPDPHH